MPEEEAEGEDKPYAKGVDAGVAGERKRILAILTHPAADANAALAAKMIGDGTSASRATSYLSAASGGKGRLASRMAAFEGVAPGPDGRRAAVNGGDGDMNTRMAARNAAARAVKSK